MVPVQSWLFVAYGAGLFWLLVNQQRIERQKYFRLSWIIYALAVVCAAERNWHNWPGSQHYADAVAWLLLAASMLLLLPAVGWKAE